MNVVVADATGGTGRLIVRIRHCERPFRRGPGSLEASAELRGVDMIEADVPDQATHTCSLVVTGAESPCLMHDPKALGS
jgi:hypothetical protein